MPTFIRVKCLFTFYDIKTFACSPQRLIHELRRFSLRLEDKDSTSDDVSIPLYVQLMDYIKKAFRTFSPGLVSNGQPIRLYWKDDAAELIAFQSNNELLEATYTMMPCGIITHVPRSKKAIGAFISLDLLNIYVCVLDKSSAAITHPSTLVVDFSPTTSSAAIEGDASALTDATTEEAAAKNASPSTTSCDSTTTTSIGPTTSSTSSIVTAPPILASQNVITAVEVKTTQNSAAPTTTTTTSASASGAKATKTTSKTSSNSTNSKTTAPLSTHASQSVIKALQALKARHKLTTPVASSSSDESSSDEYDVIRLQKEIAKSL